MQVGSQARHSGLRIQCSHSCGNCSSDQIPGAGTPCVMGWQKKKEKKRETKSRILPYEETKSGGMQCMIPSSILNQKKRNSFLAIKDIIGTTDKTWITMGDSGVKRHHTCKLPSNGAGRKPSCVCV